MIKEIIDKGFAYEVNGSVYFDVLKYNKSGNNYGILSGRKMEDAVFADLITVQDNKVYTKLSELKKDSIRV